MKVILKKTIVEQLVEAQKDAQEKKREIDRIELTDNEYKQLLRETNIYRPSSLHGGCGYKGMFFGVRVFVIKEDF